MNIMFKTTNGCNVNCSYCFDKISQEKHFHKMPAKRVIEIFDKITDNDLEIYWVWHGGEPLLAGYDWFEEVLYGMKLISIQKGAKLNFGLQTNGILLDEKFINLFDKYDVTISISYDGFNNILSRGYEKPKYADSVLAGIIVVNPFNIDHLADNYIEHCKTGYQQFHTNIMFPPLGMTIEQAWGIPVEEIAKKYLDYLLFYLYYQDGCVSDNTVNDWISSSLGKVTNYCAFLNCFKTDLLAIDYKGDLYKCDATYPELYLGNVDDYENLNDVFKSPVIQRNIELLEKQKQSYCKNCPWTNTCYQGCWTRSLEESNGERPFSLHCALTKTIIPELFKRLYNLTPEDMMKLNPVVRELLITHMYIPYYLKQKWGLI